MQKSLNIDFYPSHPFFNFQLDPHALGYPKLPQVNLTYPNLTTIFVYLLQSTIYLLVQLNPHEKLSSPSPPIFK